MLDRDKELESTEQWQWGGQPFAAMAPIDYKDAPWGGRSPEVPVKPPVKSEESPPKKIRFREFL